MKPAATLATFSDFRLVKTRKLAQFVFELPIEKADEALAALGGLPRSDGERWCGIALVNKESAAPSADATHGPVNVTTDPGSDVAMPAEAVTAGTPKPKRHFSELPRSAQAAMLCENPVFQNWADMHLPYLENHNELDPVERTAEQIRRRCDVKSRAEFDTHNPAATRWDALHARYLSETNQMAEKRA